MTIRLPRERGGWWHAYVCDVHGIELEHVGLLSGEFPVAGAPCPYGCRIDTPAVRGAWTVLAHRACADAIYDLAQQPDEEEQNTAAWLLDEYAELYATTPVEHAGAQEWMLRGRLFHQALTEALWGVTIAHAAWALVEAGVDIGDGVRRLLGDLAAAARTGHTSLVDQGKRTSNYLAWLCAVGACCSRDEWWLEGPDGMYAHILAATGEDGWQWEGSTYYHAFVLLAARQAIAGIPGAQPPAAVAERLDRMQRVLTELQTPSGLLPALHDGPYERPGFDAELALLGIPGEAGTGPLTVFADAGYAVVRNAGIHAVLAYGPHGGSHGHYDKCSLSLYGRVPWQPDPGQVPYAHPLWRTHYASTAAHPTVSIDGADQAECTGRLVASDDNSITVACDEAYEGVGITRRVAITEDGLIDEVHVTCDRPRTIALHLRPAVAVTVRHDDERSFTTRWGTGDVLLGQHEAEGATLFVRPGPGAADDPQRVVPWIDWVVTGQEATYTSRYRKEI